MSDNSEVVDAEETPLAAVTDDSYTVQHPLNSPSDDFCKQGYIDPVVEVKPEDLEDVKQEPADETDNSAIIPEIVSLDRPSDDFCKKGYIDPVVEVKLEDLQDVKQEPIDETDNEDRIQHYAVKVRF